jgi:methylglutaconyl-CoA hydratase
VIEPAVSRKIGKTAMTQMTLAAHEWKTADWALEKGLYAKLAQDQVELDIDIDHFTSKLASYNPDALFEMKKIIWEGTQDWDTLLLERAAVTGQLVLSNYAKNALEQFKKKK